jgi:hypothetical protein
MPISNHFGVISIFWIKYFLLSNCFKYLNFYSKIALQLLVDNNNNNNNIVDRRRKIQDQPQPLSSLLTPWAIYRARCEQQLYKMPSRLETKGSVQLQYRWKMNERSVASNMSSTCLLQTKCTVVWSVSLVATKNCFITGLLRYLGKKL